MNPNKIRPIAIGAFLKGDKLLVFEGFDQAKNKYFYRPLGGGIEYGETSQAALIREMQEEIGAEVTNLRLLGVIENIFTFDQQIGHEIVFIYAGQFTDAQLYTKDTLEAVEAKGQAFKAIWKPLADFGSGSQSQALLYPTGLLELLTQL